MVFLAQRAREVDKEGSFFLVSSDGVDTGVRTPRVLEVALDLEESFLTARPLRCARSLLISVVSADGSESGNALVLVLVTEDEVGVDARLDMALLLDRQPYVAVPRLPTGVLVTSTTSDSRTVNFSLDRGRSRSRSLLVLCVLVRIFLGVAVRDLDRGVVTPRFIQHGVVLFVGFARAFFCEVSVALEVFFLVTLEAVVVLFTFIRLVRMDTLPAMDELSLPPSLVPSPPVAPSRTSSGNVDPHGSSYTEQQLTRLESQEASSKPPQLLA